MQNDPEENDLGFNYILLLLNVGDVWLWISVIINCTSFTLFPPTPTYVSCAGGHASCLSNIPLLVLNSSSCMCAAVPCLLKQSHWTTRQHVPIPQSRFPVNHSYMPTCRTKWLALCEPQAQYPTFHIHMGIRHPSVCPILNAGYRTAMLHTDWSLS